MCGILYSISSAPRSPSADHIALISHRGPDAIRTRVVHRNGRTQSFTSSLLSVRGSTPIPQPLEDPTTGSVLCWNGEAWRITGVPLPPGENDTLAVFELLLARGIDGLRELEGEFAFVFYDAPLGVCWFGRDWAGRRSLVMRREEDTLMVASVGDDKGGWEEIETGGVWRSDVVSGEMIWHTLGKDAEMLYEVPKMNMALPTVDDESAILNIDSPEVSSLHDALVKSLRLRVRDIQLPPDTDLHSRLRKARPEDDVRVAILFSGGVDCTTMARIAHDILPPDEPVDLLNVAFENPRIVAARNAAAKKEGTKVDGTDPVEIDPYALCPDRTTGLSSFHELRKTCPTRFWRFISINVPYTELLAHRPTVIHLMHPHNTEMDLSIALAFYFAARGQSDDYTTPARILLSGLGADELFGGYSRHSTAFRRAGYQGLLDELNLDFLRLGKRNLGRDDRVAAHWAKEMRYPFLDDKVVAWAMRTPVTGKCSFGKSEDDGIENGKKVLRLLAKKLGMPTAAAEAKRAVQFGARSAKTSVESRKTKGTDALVV
ncbi:asparagine synthase-domain-containing protein [Tricharina praecox]|uniref:asparagine synthase-domain-containing protein n=1 Tax=Tricharina praecox TaxID=43433 RepID=UPI0022207CCB|nr:asparagine synthase-domain-containing protein [Tricharina praecox]KAI5852026.1 asparagine synthase-domain-containing protein [Tricharina praecox]